MHCRNCDYPLWNLKARQCPECGEPFRPSQFEFTANSVRFCCPQCDKAYYGTDGSGHLVPREFDCVACGLHLNMDEMVLRPAEGVAERQTRVDPMPWLHREGRNIVMAWLGTVGRSMGMPTRLMRVTPVGSAGGAGWAYAALTLLLIILLGSGVTIFGIGLLELLSGGSGAGGIFIFGVCAVIVAFTLAMVFLWLWGAVTHGVLRLTGGAAHPMQRTQQAINYSAGACLFAAVPCLGPYLLWMIGGLWWAISACFMVAEAQKVHGGRATLATLAFPATLAVLLSAAAMAGFFFGMSQVQVAMTSAVVTTRVQQSTWQARLLADGLHAYAIDHGGSGPVHAIELLDVASLSATGFASMGTDTDSGDVPIADLDLDRFFLAGPELRQDLIDRAVAAQPPNVIAHRLGDYVFTYHGMDLLSMPEDLWVFIVSPDPDQNESRSINGELVVGRLDSNVEPIAAEDFDVRLAEQNDLRAAEGLPPLPDPATVTHGKPATAGDAKREG